MIPGIHEAYLLIFLKTLNSFNWSSNCWISKFFVLPPKYYHQIEENLIHSENNLYELFASRCHELLLGKFDSDNSNTSLATLSDMNKTDTLMNYQRDELRYHKNNEDKWKQLKDMSNRAYIDRLLATFIKYYLFTKNVNICFTTEEKWQL